MRAFIHDLESIVQSLGWAAERRPGGAQHRKLETFPLSGAQA